MTALALRTLLLLALAGIASAHAADWHEAGTVMERGITVYVDQASAKVDHDVIAQGWVRFDYLKPQIVDGRSLFRHTSLRMVNCDSQRYWVSESWGYPTDGGSPIALASGAQEWQLPLPGSESEMAVQALCNETRSIFGSAWAIIKGALSLDN